MPEDSRLGASDSRVEEELVERARQAMERAYAPYSGFHVGAALESVDGRCFEGCNVENASYPVGTCAERVALGTAVAAGAHEFRRIAIVASGDRPASPCGMCRQALSEFAIDIEIVSATTDGRIERWKLRDLLPEHFELDAGSSAGAPSS